MKRVRIEEVRGLLPGAVLTEHFRQRMYARGLRYTDIQTCIVSGEIIEQYPEDYPHPSCLINGNGIHVVCAVGEDQLYIITAYRPAPDRWLDGGRTRKG